MDLVRRLSPKNKLQPYCSKVVSIILKLTIGKLYIQESNKHFACFAKQRSPELPQVSTHQLCICEFAKSKPTAPQLTRFWHEMLTQFSNHVSHDHSKLYDKHSVHMSFTISNSMFELYKAILSQAINSATTFPLTWTPPSEGQCRGYVTMVWDTPRPLDPASLWYSIVF